MLDHQVSAMNSALIMSKGFAKHFARQIQGACDTKLPGNQAVLERKLLDDEEIESHNSSSLYCNCVWAQQTTLSSKAHSFPVY